MSGRSFGGRYRASLAGDSLAGVGAPDARAAESVGVRGRAGYSFWQRYWASFTGMELPVRPKGAAGRDDPALAASGSGLKRPLEGTLTEAELDALLGRLGDAATGLAPASMSVETPGAVGDVSVVSDGAATFSVTLRLVPVPGRLLPEPLTIALEAGRTYFVARVSPDGAGTFRHVPAGALTFRRIRQPSPTLAPTPGQGARTGRSGDFTVALPAPPTGNSLAAASTARSAVLRVVLPKVALVLHREPGDEFLLEVVDGEPDETPLIVTIRYGTMSGAARDLVIPVAGKSALARLPGYSPDALWEASTVSATPQFQDWDPERIALSVQATANNATRRAWRAVSEFAPAEIRDLIEAELR